MINYHDMLAHFYHKYQNHILTALIIIALVLAALFSSRLFKHVATSTPDSRFNKEFSLTLTDYSGKSVPLNDYAHKVLIAYSWASWCPYCAAEIQDLATLKKTYGDTIQIIAINRGESLQIAKDFSDHIADTSGVTFLLDPNDAFFKSIGGYAMPEMVFIDGGGNIIYHQRGPIQMTDIQARLSEIVK